MQFTSTSQARIPSGVKNHNKPRGKTEENGLDCQLGPREGEKSVLAPAGLERHPRESASFFLFFPVPKKERGRFQLKLKRNCLLVPSAELWCCWKRNGYVTLCYVPLRRVALRTATIQGG